MSNFGRINPFISITPSKPFISSGSLFTLFNWEIYYLSPVYYDLGTADLIFIRVNIYPGLGERGLLLISEPIYFIRVTIYLAALSYYISRGHYLPRAVGVRGLQLIFQPINFIRVTIYPATIPYNISRGHYLPSKLYCLVLACIKAILYSRPLSFCHDIANI